LGSIKQALELFRDGHTAKALEVSRSAPVSEERFRLQIKILIGQNIAGSNIGKALKLTEKWKRFAPGSPEPWIRQLEIHVYNRQLRLAKKAYLQIKKRAPQDSRTFYYKGLLLQLSGRLNEALDDYKTSIVRRRTNNQEVLTPVESSVMAAQMAYRVAGGHHPGTRRVKRRGVLRNSKVLVLFRSCVEAWDEEVCGGSRISEKQARELSIAWRLLGLNGMGTEWGLQCFRNSLKWNEHHEEARSNLLFALNYSPEISSQDIFQEHLESGRWFHQHNPERNSVFKNVPEREKNLKVAYLSSDFNDHSVARFILPVLQHHDEHCVTTYAYSNSSADDDYTDKIRTAATHFRSIKGRATGELVDQIVDDEIDILVDLNGHSGEGHIALFARRAAPLQVNWIGYPNTSGLETIDYRIVDQVTDPLPDAQRLCTEQLLIMPRTFSVYQAPDELPDLAVGKHKSPAGIRFGSFNYLAKLNDALFATWAQILARTPGSTLLIKNLAMDIKSNRSEVLDKFTQHGIESNRLKFRGFVKNRIEHLEIYNEVDLSLDSFPYNGTTTNCESLIMGVPILTRAGNDHRSRVSASHLSAVKLEELITSSEEDYIEIAVALANDRTRLSTLSEGLRERMLSSPLMDAAGFTRELEAGFRQIWVNWCEQAQAGESQ
jgi:protein O-GlcNAc transferase